MTRPRGINKISGRLIDKTKGKPNLGSKIFSKMIKARKDVAIQNAVSITKLVKINLVELVIVVIVILQTRG